MYVPVAVLEITVDPFVVSFSEEVDGKLEVTDLSDEVSARVENSGRILSDGQIVMLAANHAMFLRGMKLKSVTHVGFRGYQVWFRVDVPKQTT